MKDFMFYDKMRWWVYEYDAALTQQHCVRVTYREGLTIDPNSREPAFLPVTATAEGELCTCPQGQEVLQSMPPGSQRPTIEPWTFAEKSAAEGARLAAEQSRKRSNSDKQKKADQPKVWHKTKVFNDIFNHHAKLMSPQDVDQWRALENFHDRHATSDCVPTLPFDCTSAAGGVWPVKHGMPVDWDYAWTVLQERFPRPHLHAGQTLVATVDAADAPSPAGVPATEPRRYTEEDVTRLNVVAGTACPALHALCALCEGSACCVLRADRWGASAEGCEARS